MVRRIQRSVQERIVPEDSCVYEHAERESVDLGDVSDALFVESLGPRPAKHFRRDKAAGSAATRHVLDVCDGRREPEVCEDDLHGSIFPPFTKHVRGLDVPVDNGKFMEIRYGVANRSK